MYDIIISLFYHFFIKGKVIFKIRIIKASYAFHHIIN